MTEDLLLIDPQIEAGVSPASYEEPMGVPGHVVKHVLHGTAGARAGDHDRAGDGVRGECAGGAVWRERGVWGLLAGDYHGE